MLIEIRYLSKSGNTKKIADSIGEALNIEAKPITEKVNKTDILFLGGAPYGFDIDKELKDFIKNLENVEEVVLFSTSAMFKVAISKMKNLLNKKDIKVNKLSFYTRAEYGNVSKGRPNEKDLARARAFANKVVKGER